MGPEGGSVSQGSAIISPMAGAAAISLRQGAGGGLFSEFRVGRVQLFLMMVVFHAA
ncbi:hypothetical protein PAP18089_03966 [Pandoraea apista]|uniref:Uncharacterized protein n=1 Tax=Pandoraea apista TaxID=93218 RepID=A0A5E5P9N9_9BURK|nr:hypothetical protein LMG16407_03920 [Pandoraea apista]VVG72963.1 hypothetical protein PAP18089_03966 [Pandoraea apista]